MSYIPGIKVWDEVGLNFKGFSYADGQPRFIAKPFGWVLSEGSIPDHTVFTKFGFNPDVDNATEDIWDLGGTYVFPAAAIQMQVISSNANDDGAPPGTGVRTVGIHYLTNTFAEAFEEVTLNGVGAVNTVATNIYRVNYFLARTVGSGGVAAGNIDLQSVGGATTYARISAGNLRSRSAIFTVPTGKHLLIAQITASAGCASAANWVRFTLRANYDDIVNVSRTFFLPHWEATVQNGALCVPMQVIEHLPQGTDVRVVAIGDAAATNGACSIELRGWLGPD